LSFVKFSSIAGALFDLASATGTGDVTSFSEVVVFAPQLVLFGAQGYFTDNIGANFELSVGAPHFFSIGLNYRFKNTIYAK